MRPTWTRLTLPVLLAGMLSFAAAVSAIAENQASVTVGATAVEVLEGGNGATYTVVLDSEPTGDVVIAITPDDQLTADVAELTFTTANWNIEQLVTVTAVDDVAAEGEHAAQVTHAATSADGNYDGLAIADVSVQITDNDSAGVTLGAAEVELSEGGGGAAYAIVLDSEPAGDVVIAITPDDQLTADVSELTFTTANWNIEQLVTVTAVDDDVAEGEHAAQVTHAATSADGDYDGLAIASVAATIDDDDAAGVTVNPLAVGVTESGDSATYTVVLDSEPTGDVVVTIMKDDQVTVDVSELSFTPANWSVEQVVTVIATDDGLAEGDHAAPLTHVMTSTDGDYDGISVPAVSAQITDNDARGVTIAPQVLELREGGDASTYAVVLDSEPAGDVVITIAPDDQLTADVAELTFTTANWNIEQLVTVTAVDDDVAEGEHAAQVTHAATSADGAYDGLAIASVAVTIVDDEAAGVTVNPLAVGVSEGGDSATYTVVLDSEPTGDVVIAITPDNQLTVDVSERTFTPANWHVEQLVTIIATDDDLAEGDRTGVIAHGAAGGGYDDVEIAAVSVQVTDNDEAGVTVNPLAVGVTEGGDSATYTVVLDSEPTGDVRSRPARWCHSAPSLSIVSRQPAAAPPCLR